MHQLGRVRLVAYWLVEAWNQCVSVQKGGTSLYCSEQAVPVSPRPAH